MNPDQFFDPNEYEVGIIWIENSVQIILISDSFGLRTSLGLIRIGSDTDFGINWNKSDWFGINFNSEFLSG